MRTSPELDKGELLLVVDVDIDHARPCMQRRRVIESPSNSRPCSQGTPEGQRSTWPCSGAPNGGQRVGKEGGDVLLVACRRQAPHVHAPRMPRGLLAWWLHPRHEPCRDVRYQSRAQRLHEGIRSLMDLRCLMEEARGRTQAQRLGADHGWRAAGEAIAEAHGCRRQGGRHAHCIRSGKPGGHQRRDANPRHGHDSTRRGLIETCMRRAAGGNYYAGERQSSHASRSRPGRTRLPLPPPAARRRVGPRFMAARLPAVQT